MVSALTLASQGIKVHLVEKAKELGGIGRRIYYTVKGEMSRPISRSLSRRVY